MPRRKREPIPLYRRDGTMYEGEDIDAMRANFELQFDRYASKYIRLVADEKRDLSEVILAAMLQGMAYALSPSPDTKENID